MWKQAILKPTIRRFGVAFLLPTREKTGGDILQTNTFDVESLLMTFNDNTKTDNTCSYFFHIYFSAYFTKYGTESNHKQKYLLQNCEFYLESICCSSALILSDISAAIITNVELFNTVLL